MFEGMVVRANPDENIIDVASIQLWTYLTKLTQRSFIFCRALQFHWCPGTPPNDPSSAPLWLSLYFFIDIWLTWKKQSEYTKYDIKHDFLLFLALHMGREKNNFLWFLTIPKPALENGLVVISSKKHNFLLFCGEHIGGNLL